MRLNVVGLDCTIKGGQTHALLEGLGLVVFSS